MGTLVGRDAELAALEGWLDDALACRPRVVVVSGPPGIGKTAVLDAAMVAGRQRGARAALGRVAEVDGSPPFWPWRQVLVALDAEDRLLGEADMDNPAAQRFARFEVVVGVLSAAARAGGGLVVALDDAHCADPGSLRLLDHVAHRVTDEPLLLVVSHRSEPTDYAEGVAATLASLARSPNRRSIVLAGLDLDAISAVLPSSTDAATVERVLELTGGNSLFVAEMASHLAAGGSLDTMPATIRDVVSERIAARSSACASMLQVAALAGTGIDLPVLAAALDAPVATVLDHLEEAVAAGLLTRPSPASRYRFTHEVLRDAVEATIPPSQRAQLHRSLAEAILTHHGTHRDHLDDIARHWEAAAVLCDADVAAGWQERAAAAAEQALAWENAARLYGRALALGGAAAPPSERYRRLHGLARALVHSDDIGRAVPLCIEAADAAEEAGRPDLAAEALLLVEGRGGSAGPEIGDVLARSDSVLSAIPTDRHDLRARLIGLQAALSFYVDPARSEALSADAIAEAKLTDDPRATVSATRARQMNRLAAEHAEERLGLARRIGDAGRRLADATVEVWEPLWRIEALMELGRLPEAVDELPKLRRLVGRSGLPIARWHLLRTDATLAAAAGRWAEAEVADGAARAIYAMLEGLGGAIAQQFALRTSIALNRGFEPDAVAEYLALDMGTAPDFLGDLPYIAPVPALVALGRVDEAHQWYDRAVPVDRWEPSPFLRNALVALRCFGAIGLGRSADVSALRDRLTAARGMHVCGGGGTLSYLGPVTLVVGEAAVALRRWADAVPDLRSAIEEARQARTSPFEVRAQVLLAEALAGRGEAGDADESARLADAARPRATALEMRPWSARLDQLEASRRGATSSAGPLSPRELEVAGLVADGLTNREIATALFISERTAQNHVQHILTKLGLGNRTQVATWYRAH